MKTEIIKIKLYTSDNGNAIEKVKELPNFLFGDVDYEKGVIGRIYTCAFAVDEQSMFELPKLLGKECQMIDYFDYVCGLVPLFFEFYTEYTCGTDKLNDVGVNHVCFKQKEGVYTHKKAIGGIFVDEGIFGDVSVAFLLTFPFVFSQESVFCVIGGDTKRGVRLLEHDFQNDPEIVLSNLLAFKEIGLAELHQPKGKPKDDNVPKNPFNKK